MNVNTKIKRELKEAEIMLSDVETAIKRGWWVAQVATPAGSHCRGRKAQKIYK